MKETTTVYKCTCGREFDTWLCACVHWITLKCCGHISRKELTRNEYQAWLSRNA